MAVRAGEKIHVITRRLFVGDLRRHFVGMVEGVSGVVIRARGFVFVFDETSNDFIRRDEERVRLFSASDAGFIINVIPSETELAQVRYETDGQGRRIVTDGKALRLNVSEFSARR